MPAVQALDAKKKKLGRRCGSDRTAGAIFRSAGKTADPTFIPCHIQKCVATGIMIIMLPPFIVQTSEPIVSIFTISLSKLLPHHPQTSLTQHSLHLSRHHDRDYADKA